ncbi:S-layer homology domain-containing protein [Bacillus infantis]|uniref:S-layer homology domain-containing protein n=1 Tax=Bacillus infantis TaxID=324767 RepID=UPI003CF7C617
MAYQSKNYKKFIATSMTAAMVASAVAPAASFAASDFKDVKADNFYYDYITALADADIIDGRPDGTFDLGGKINRAEASKMVANILKLDTDKAPAAKFSDVDQSKWYAEYINALYAEGLIDGKGAGKFDPNGTLTRGEFAKMVVDAYDLTLNANGPKANFTDVKADKWYADYVAILFSHELVTGTTSTTFSPDAQIKRADFAKLLTETDWEKGSTLEKPNAAQASVDSVTGVNAKTIEVKFTKAVDTKTIDAITLEAGTGASDAGTVSKELSADGKTLTLKAQNIFKGSYTVKVPFEAVKDTDGEFVKPVNAKVTVNDTAAPVLTTAAAAIKDTADGIKKVTLTFDEEVSAIETVKINGTNYDATVAGNKATVAVNLDATKTYDVTVVNAKDAANNVKAVQTKALTLSVDNVAPSITSVTAAGENQVKVAVDEELAKSLVVTAKVGTYTANIVEEIKVNPENSKEYIVTLNDSYLYKNGNSDTVTLTAAKDALSDEIGNTNAAEITKTVTVNKDVTAPSVVKVETSKTAGKVSSFSVTYSEEVTVNEAGKISVVNSKGEILSSGQVVTGAKVAANDAKTVVFTLAGDLKADKYSFVLAEGFTADKALAPNNSAKYEFTVDVTEDGQPVETTFDVNGATSAANVITVDFGEKVLATGTGSALNPAAYSVNGTVLPVGTDIAFKRDNGVVDQTTVEITLPEGFVKSNDEKAVFTVTGIKTLDNKESLPFTQTLEITDNTAPEVTSLTVTNLTEVTVAYSENIAITGTNPSIADEISLLDSKGAVVTFTDSKVENGKLVLTVADSSKVSSLATIKVNAEDANLKDAAGNAQKSGMSVVKK